MYSGSILFIVVCFLSQAGLVYCEVQHVGYYSVFISALKA